jgi:Flp pilus assembly protein TadB
MIALLPYVVVVVFRVFFPDWLTTLFDHPYGPGLLFMAVCLQIIGFTWLHRLMRTEVW